MSSSSFGYLTFGICVLILAVGRTIERNLEYAMWILMSAVFGYLLLIDLTMVSAPSWRAILTGFVSFGALPSGGDWLLLGAFAAYQARRRVERVTTNWMRDKGFAMGATVGHIPAATGTPVSLSPQGNIFIVNEQSLRRWKDCSLPERRPWAVFAVGSIVGMMLVTLMSLEFYLRGMKVGGWAVADIQASAIAERHGRVFGT